MTPRPDTGLGLLRAVAMWFAAATALVGVSIAYVDRPVALFVHAELRDGPVAATVARLPETITLVPVLTLIVAAISLLAGIAVAKVLRVGATALASFLIAEAIKTALKFAFGRTWPETWVHGNPSFIRDGVYEFLPFHGGAGFASFPSGHMTAATSVMTVAWLLLPRGRPAWAVVVILSAIGLLAMNYHFVGDVVAGFFLGAAVSVGVVHLSRHVLPAGPRG